MLETGRKRSNNKLTISFLAGLLPFFSSLLQKLRRTIFFGLCCGRKASISSTCTLAGQWSENHTPTPCGQDKTTFLFPSITTLALHTPQLKLTSYRT